MTRISATTLLALLLLTPGLAAQTRALVGATVIDGNGGPPLSDGVILLEGDRIGCVGSEADCPVPEGAERIGLEGRFVTPGLVDAHVHFSQTGWLDGRPDGLTAPEVYPYHETSRVLRENPGLLHRSYLCTGITAVYDVGGHPWTTSLPTRYEDDPNGAHVRAAGPLVTHASVPALQVDDEHYTFLPMGTDEEALASVDAVARMGSTALKVWYLRVPPDGQVAMDARLMKIGEAARAAGLDLIVHATGLREAKAALRAGASLLVHSVEDQLVDEEFLELARANGTVYAPTLMVGANWARAMASVVLDAPQSPDDPNGCVDGGTVAKIRSTAPLSEVLPERLRGNVEYVYRRMEGVGRGRFVMAENLRRVHEAGITIATATDAGNPLTLHGPSIYNEMEAMQEAGVSPEDIVTMSTRNGALAMGRLDDLGTLEAGKIADVLILREDPTRDASAFRSLTHVIRAGVMHRQEDLAYRPVS
jgi:imidazolonepropionase-like amidohydrolase